MTKNDRQKKIIRELRKHRVLKTTQLYPILPVSVETIRKDIQELSKKGLLHRSFGEISIVENEASLQKLGIISKVERQKKIIEFLGTRETVRISTLSNHFGVSLPTIRNDLQSLEQSGLISKKHGYVTIILQRYIKLFQSDINFSEEESSCGLRGLSLINYRDTIFLGPSRINEFIALHLPLEKEVTIVTNSLHIIELLSRRDYPREIIAVQGAINKKSKNINMTATVDTINLLTHLAINKIFVSIESYCEDGFIQYSTKPDMENLRILSALDCKFILYVSKMQSQRSSLFDSIDINIFQNRIKEAIFFGEPLESTLNIYTELKFCHHGIVESHFSHDMKIGFSIPHLMTNFFHQIKASLEERIRDDKGVSLLVQNMKYSASSNLKHIDYFISKNINLLIEFMYDDSKINLISEKCRAESIDIITIDSFCPGSYFVGINNYLVGKCAGENIIKLVKNKWNGRVQNLVIITRNHVGYSTASRSEGLKNVLHCSMGFENLNTFEINIDYDSTEYIHEFYSYLEENRFLGNTIFVFLNEYGLLKMYDTILKEIPAEKGIIVVCTSSKEVITPFLERGDALIGGFIEIKAEDYAIKIASIIHALQHASLPPQINHIDHAWVSIPFD